ncbi:similar to Saccharomyces cerevisiae YMR029C FAR8 Protein involved in recovery from cell cycle arrest in response to pheromone, in a Far1p-independent pathway [Maudiozyma saulgeensis]|uniref:Similar to Saccharomyces cerevisiae YMR029C FAR8 Protein involved in recovery from cell cycle arrest in response to pheromone, in a Far1p-independent pathway n=1 Tax=Maudiozyma saulgeensis TaxID=1789683 RepID=A0A1X7R826_9SACH|nr:similar to Saccharomyces cerevisiae YMR029C FAR8 Protein involved in recovery from cell cycle arrest in response to pheromone, in a Far1p-independent pathway [Kazachstania saulgeensis]
MSGHIHRQYTLPGVMHYLQTEFTKNERDRITWELEKSEMKAYIMKLEGENKDLRHNIAELQIQSNEKLDLGNGISNDSTQKQVDSESLMKAKTIVEDNVKDIIHLLNSPSVLSQFDSLNGRKAPVHEMENLSINKDNNTKSMVPESLFNNKPKSPIGGSQSSASYSVSGQFENMVNISNNKQFLSVFKNNILVTLDDKLKLFHIDEEAQCNDTGLTIDLLNTDLVKGMFWLSSEFIMILDNNGIKVWSSIQQKIINEINIFQESGKGKNEIVYGKIKTVDFKNKWLLMTIEDHVQILELEDMKDPHMMSIKTSYIINSNNILDVLLGITEMSFIVLAKNPLALVIYDFDGEILQSIKLDKEITDKINTKSGKLYLNKESSKLIIQLGKHLIFYSFDQKRVTLQFTLNSEPKSMYFRYATDTVGIAYDDGTVELRELPNFANVIKKYVHNPENGKANKNNIVIEATKISNFETILLSLSENVLKLEAFEEKP